MKQKNRSREQVIEEQMQRWRLMQIQTSEEKIRFPTITISREPGSGGSIVAKKLAGKLEFDLFHQEILHEIAQKSQVSAQILSCPLTTVSRCASFLHSACEFRT